MPGFLASYSIAKVETYTEPRRTIWPITIHPKIEIALRPKVEFVGVISC